MLAPCCVGSTILGRNSYHQICPGPCARDIGTVITLLSIPRDFRRAAGGSNCYKGDVLHTPHMLGASATEGSSDMPLAAGDIVEAKPAGREKDLSAGKAGTGHAKNRSREVSSRDSACRQPSSILAASTSGEGCLGDVLIPQQPEVGTSLPPRGTREPSTADKPPGKSISRSARARTSSSPACVVSNGADLDETRSPKSPRLGAEDHPNESKSGPDAVGHGGYKVSEATEVPQSLATGLPTAVGNGDNLQKGEGPDAGKRGGRRSSRARAADGQGNGAMPSDDQAPGVSREEVRSAVKDANGDDEVEEEEEELPKQVTTVRMVRLPGGRLVDPRLVKGWVVLPDGRKVVCGRCGGRSTIMSREGMDDCLTCFPFRESEVKRRGPLTPEHRQKISAANKGRKRRPLGEAHKEKISRGMQEVYASGEQQARIAASVAGRPKTCTVCGQAGHNRATCPQGKAQGGGDVVMPKKVGQERERVGETSVVAPRAMSDGRSSRFKGVSWSKENGKWRAQCWTGSKVHLIGFFAEEEEAARAFDVYVLEARGLNTQINFHPADYGIEVKAPEPAAPASQRIDIPSDREEMGRMPAEQLEPAGPSSQRAYALPMRRDELVREAIAAVRRAWLDGVRRQRVVFLLPQDGRLFEASGWPGGIRQQFAGARGLVEAVLLGLKRLPDLQGPLSAEWVDEADCVGAWQSNSLAAVLFPTSYVLPQLRLIDAAEGGRRLTLVINPQWQTDGQIVSDFGFGRARQEAETFVDSFTDVCVMERLRMNGDEVRLYKAYPGAWQVHFMWPNGKGHLLVGTEEERPCYDRILELLRRVPGSQASRSWLDRISASLRPPSHLLRDPITQNPDLPPQAPTPATPSEGDPTTQSPSLAPGARSASQQDPITQTPSLPSGARSASQRDPTSQNPGGLPAALTGLSRERGATDGDLGLALRAEGERDGDIGLAFSGEGERDGELRLALRGEGEGDGDISLALRGEGQRGGDVSLASRGEEDRGVEMEVEAEDHWSTDRVEERVAQRRKSGDRGRDVDIITGLPVRDIKMEPVLQMARWQKAIFGSQDQD